MYNLTNTFLIFILTIQTLGSHLIDDLLKQKNWSYTR